MNQNRLALAFGLLTAGAGTVRAEEWGPWPYVVFTTGKQWTGSGDLIEDRMTGVSDMLRNEFDAEVRSNSWNCYADGAHEFDPGCPTNDATFLADIGNHVNSLPQGRPVIVIGHSYGGDSLLKAVNGAVGITRKIDRPVMGLFVLDPTSTAGERKTRHGFYSTVPSSVGWFFNRWQQNSPVPFNFADSGVLDRGCSAGTCDQVEQTFQRNADGSTIGVNCGWRWNWGPPGRFEWQCDPLKSNHGSLVGDAQIQKQIIDGLRSRLAARRVVTLKNMFNNKYMVAEGGGGQGSLVNADRTQALQWEHVEITDVNGGALISGDKITLATYNGFFVSAQADGSVLADRPKAFAWETFSIFKRVADSSPGSTIVSGDTVILLSSAHQNRIVALQGDDVAVGLTAATDCAPLDRCYFRITGRTQ